MRASGILLPIFSLPSECGIGDLYKEAFRFVDWLQEAKQRYWQVLPIGPVNKELCPYQSSSSFAGESLLISLDKLAEKGFLTEEEAAAAADQSLTREEKLQVKRKALRTAFRGFRACLEHDEAAKLHYKAFCKMEEKWLDDFAIFEALTDYFGDGDWSHWEESIRHRDRETLVTWAVKLSYEIEFYRWTQYEFFMQWHDLKSYANAKGIQLIGDLPYYTAFESADCWANPQLFQLDETGSCKFEAGAPPDAFTAEGQCWGNPVYDWSAHKAQEYKWWISRIHQQLRFFDVLRIDHMRGFESYYVIPADTEEPKEGHWEKGPGMELFHAVHAALGECRFIAEDLGYLTQEVKDMMGEAGYPGMKILQFAFDTSEENVYLPFNYDTDNAVIYTGTHDNDTTLGWYEKAEDWKQRFVAWYLREKSEIPQERKDELFGSNVESADEILDPETAVKGLIELAHSSRCDTCIIPMQDYLLLGSEARVNVPGVAKGNWRWQMSVDACNQKLAATIGEVTARYGR